MMSSNDTVLPELSISANQSRLDEKLEFPVIVTVTTLQDHLDLLRINKKGF